MIEKNEIMTIPDMIQWLSVLNEGYSKPDLSGNSGTVRETKDFKPFIMRLNEKLCGLAGMECPSVEVFAEFKNNKHNEY